jgi:hypothetical protein
MGQPEKDLIHWGGARQRKKCAKNSSSAASVALRGNNFTQARASSGPDFTSRVKGRGATVFDGVTYTYFSRDNVPLNMHLFRSHVVQYNSRAVASSVLLVSRLLKYYIAKIFSTYDCILKKIFQ